MAGDPCGSSSTGTTEQFNVPSDVESDLPFIFDCEGGNFEVFWSGSVTLTESIRIGRGTTVSICGDHDNGLSTSNCFGADDSIIETTFIEDEESEIVAEGVFGSIFHVEAGSLNLVNMALRDGNASGSNSTGISDGGGLYAHQADITVTGCTFEDMFAGYWGGGIYSNGSRLLIQDTVFRRCSAGKIPEAGQDHVEAAGGALGVSASASSCLCRRSSVLTDASLLGRWCSFPIVYQVVLNPVYILNAISALDVLSEVSKALRMDTLPAFFVVHWKPSHNFIISPGSFRGSPQLVHMQMSIAQEHSHCFQPHRASFTSASGWVAPRCSRTVSPPHCGRA